MAAVQIVLAPLNIRALYSDAAVDDDYCAAIADLAWHTLARKSTVGFSSATSSLIPSSPIS